MLVATPTAIPDAPFISMLGIIAGSTSGSFSVLSKFGTKFTVSLSRSLSISSAIFASLTSVYLMQPGGSPSIEPKLPCPSTSVWFMENSCAILTSASYIGESPCGWSFPITSPTILALFFVGWLWTLFMLYIV